MKYFVFFSLIAITVTSCCYFKNCESGRPAIYVELRDKNTGDDLYNNGLLSLDSVDLRVLKWSSQNYFVDSTDERTRIYFYPNNEEYSLRISSTTWFNINLELEEDKSNCCIKADITSLEVDKFDYQSEIMPNNLDWLTVVWID